MSSAADQRRPPNPTGDRAFDTLATTVCNCFTCPRLVAWREQVAAERRASFSDQQYWGRPVPGIGDPEAWLLVLGLAPAAHGANRTGRVFTGDRSGDWLFAAMHRAGLANQPESVSAADGLTLTGAWVTAAVKCAPPDNRPTPAERDACRPYLLQELAMLANLRVIVALGAFAWQVALTALAERGMAVPRPRPKFGHEAVCHVGDLALVGSFHPSQQNTFTGRLTEPMLDAAFARARALAGR